MANLISGQKEFEIALELLFTEENTRYGLAHTINVDCGMQHKFNFINKLIENNLVFPIKTYGNGKPKTQVKIYSINKKELWYEINKQDLMKKILKAIEKSNNKLVIEFDKLW